MKNLLTSAVLALAVSGFVTASSFAGCTFGLCTHHGCGCCGCGAKFCVRQYNAFSPVCCGTVFCDGCCPFGSGCGPGAYGPGFAGACGPCAGGMCPGGSCGMPFSGVMSGAPGCDNCLGSLPSAEGMPVESAPANAVIPPSANPVATPSPLPTGQTSQRVNDRVIQNASYRPASTPVYNYARPAVRPVQPQMMAAPSYWNN
jgi:hypothetical protein